MTLSFKEIRIRKILRDYENSLFRLAMSYTHNEADSQEIVQDTIIQLLRYDPKFENKEKEKAWLMKTCVNLSRNKIRFNRNHEADEIDERLAVSDSPDLSYIWEAVKALDRIDQDIIHLFYEEDYTTKEISEILGKNENTIRTRLKRARNQLKDILKEDYNFE